MNRHGFLIRTLSVILLVVSFHILGMQLLLFFVVSPPLNEIPTILTTPLPLATTLVGTYIVIFIFYSRPVFLFLRAEKKGEKPSESQVQSAQDRCINLAYFLAALSFPAYIIGGTGGAWVVGRELGWPSGVVYYGLLGGIIAGLLTIPMAIYAAGWAVKPVLERTMTVIPGLDTARTAGLKLSLRKKFIMIVMVMVVGITGYAVILGYGQADAVLKNMEEMEQLLPTSIAAELIGEVERAGDPGVRSSRHFKSRMGSLKTFFISFMIVISALAFFVSYVAAGETTRPVEALRTIAERVGQGHYDEPARIISNDEFAELGGTFNRMMETINKQMKTMESVVKSLRGGVRRIDETTNTILAVSAEQSSGSTEQAVAAEEASSIAEEIVAAARQIADGAKMVEEVAASTLSACRDGEEKLDQAQGGFRGIAQQVEAIGGAMKELEDKFRETYKIMELIEGIADQTKILSLNAGLEAVGAGIAGQRFMVVAQATQRLAVKSSEAAKDIRNLVETIQESTMEATKVSEKGKEKVIAGGRAIGEVTEALKNIYSFADSTSSTVSEITLSTQQQTTASEQLARAVTEVLEIARKVEEGAKGIETSIADLRNFAESLRASAKVDEGEAAYTA